MGRRNKYPKYYGAGAWVGSGAVLLYGAGTRGGADIGTRPTFADLGQTLAEVFGVGPLAHGTSFLAEIG